MELENRYLVFKRSDIDYALSDAEKDILALLSKKVQDYRTMFGKEQLNCVVLEKDWPEYQLAVDALEKRVSFETLMPLAEANAIALDDGRCEYFGDVKDRNGDSAIHHCRHTNNPEDTEGNCRSDICPIGCKDGL